MLQDGTAEDHAHGAQVAEDKLYAPRLLATG